MIEDPDPEAAVSFSLAVLAFSLREIILMEVITDVWAPLLPKDDNQLVHEFTSMMLRYLRTEGSADPPERVALLMKRSEVPLF